MEETKERLRNITEENLVVERSIFFDDFENDPAKFVDIEKKLKANDEILQFMGIYNASKVIYRDKIVYQVAQKNAEDIQSYLTALIVQAVCDLEEVTKEITDPEKIAYFITNQVWIENQLKRVKVKSQLFEGKVSDFSQAQQNNMQVKWSREVKKGDGADYDTRPDKTKDEQPYTDD